MCVYTHAHIQMIQTQICMHTHINTHTHKLMQAHTNTHTLITIINHEKTNWHVDDHQCRKRKQNKKHLSLPHEWLKQKALKHFLNVPPPPLLPAPYPFPPPPPPPPISMLSHLLLNHLSSFQLTSPLWSWPPSFFLRTRTILYNS